MITKLHKSAIAIPYLLLLFLSSIITSCSSSANDDITDTIAYKQLSVPEKLKICLEDESLKEMGFNSEQIVWLQTRYSLNNYKPFWLKDTVLSEKGVLLKETIDRSIWFGIPESRLRYKTSKPIDCAIQDLLLTAKSALILQDLKTGMINDSLKTYGKALFASSIQYDSLLNKVDSVSYRDFLMERSCPDTNYRFLANHLYTYCSAYPMDRTTFSIVSMKEDSINTRNKTIQALHFKGYLAAPDTLEKDFIAALKLFQEHNGLKADGKIGKYTARALNESTFIKVLRASLALDKFRRSFKYPEKFVRINIPEYLLRYYVNDSLKSIHNIIVGKEENQTPRLTSKIHTIMVYPYWNVPYSIASKEILPELKRSSSYLAKNNYKLFRGETEINPHSVNWKRIKENSFPYKIVQEPGPKNSLGIIKFEFYNNYSVYVHDTPAKSLFKTDVRAYSHGCMRCEDPVGLGKLILDYDTLRKKGNHITPDSLDSLIGLAKNYPIKLLDRVPVYVEYTTVTADRDRMIFHLDIYKKDEEYLQFMKD